jgi:hypothetical protein
MQNQEFAKLNEDSLAMIVKRCRALAPPLRGPGQVLGATVADLPVVPGFRRLASAHQSALTIYHI